MINITPSIDVAVRPSEELSVNVERLFFTIPPLEKKELPSTIKFIDLFCGIGGFRYASQQAFKRLGIKGQCMFSSDIDKFAAESYEANFKEKPVGAVNELVYNFPDIYNNDVNIRKVVDQLVDGTYSNDRELFRTLYNSLLNTIDTDKADRYFILKDFRSYADAQRRVEKAYRDASGWAKSAMLNVAKVGKFTSDRTIQEYVDGIWRLDKVELY